MKNKFQIFLKYILSYVLVYIPYLFRWYMWMEQPNTQLYSCILKTRYSLFTGIASYFRSAAPQNKFFCLQKQKPNNKHKANRY